MKKVFFILSCFLMSTSLYLSAQTRIAVYVSGVLDENYETLLGDKLVDAFAESNEYIAVNRSAALKPLLEKARYIQQSGHVDYSQVASVNQTYGETLLCGVNVIEIEDMYVLQVTLLDIQTNTVKKTASADFAKKDLKYTKILEVSQIIRDRLLPGLKNSNSGNISSANAGKNSYANTSSSIANSDVELARKRVEENRKYDISYAEFKYNYRTSDAFTLSPSSQYYMDKSRNTKYAGNWLWYLPFATGLGVGLGVGLADLDKKIKIYSICGAIGASMIPSFSCYIAASGYKRKAWKEYRKPYDDSVKELNNARKYRQRASVNIAPAVGYDWAGVNMRIVF